MDGLASDVGCIGFVVCIEFNNLVGNGVGVGIGVILGIGFGVGVVIRLVISCRFICGEQRPIIEDELIISHIVTTYNYIMSYIKVSLAEANAIKLVYDNWKDSYKQLPQFLVALHTYALGTISIINTLSAYSPDGTCIHGNGIFH